MDDDNKAIMVWLPIVGPPLMILDHMHHKLLQQCYILSLLVDAAQSEGQHRHLSYIGYGRVRQQQFINNFVFDRLWAPEYHLRHSPILPDLLLQHSPQIQNRITNIEPRPGNHMESAVPQPLVRAVLLETWSIEMILHIPLLAFHQMRIQHLLNPVD